LAKDDEVALFVSSGKDPELKRIFKHALNCRNISIVFHCLNRSEKETHPEFQITKAVLFARNKNVSGVKKFFKEFR
jgi:hypothetical protein